MQQGLFKHYKNKLKNKYYYIEKKITIIFKIDNFCLFKVAIIGYLIMMTKILKMILVNN